MELVPLPALLALTLATALLCLSPPSAAQSANFEIIAQDGPLQPAQLQVPAGVKLRITLRNTGKTPVEFESLGLHLERLVQPDSAATVTVPGLSAGSYSIGDEFHPNNGTVQILAR
jgi:hypothetical protein